MNKRSKCLNNPHSPYLQDYFTVISLKYSTVTNIWDALRNCTTESLHKFQISRTSVTLSEHQDYSSWNQTIEFSRVYHRTKFETNRCTGVLTQGNSKHVSYKSHQPSRSTLPWMILICKMNLPWASTNQQVMAAYTISFKSFAKFPRKFK